MSPPPPSAEVVSESARSYKKESTVARIVGSGSFNVRLRFFQDIF